MTNTTDTAVERGSGNVFADLGLADPDGHRLKAELVGRIDDIVRERGITTADAARLLGLSRRDVSRLLRGDFRGRPAAAPGSDQTLALGGDPRGRGHHPESGALRVYGAGRCGYWPGMTRGGQLAAVQEPVAVRDRVGGIPDSQA